MDRQYVIGSIIGAVAVTAIGGVAGYRMLESDQYAKVVSVEPALVTVQVPLEECRDELITRQKPVKDPKQVTGTVAGAVIGGVLGNQVGGGRGKDIATVGGAVAGGYAGNKIQEKIQEGNTEETLERVCTTAYATREEQDGFLVTYRLNGEDRKIHMDHDPGRRIPLENGEPVFDAGEKS